MANESLQPHNREDALEQGGGWLSMSEAAPLTPYSAEYLSLLARKGKLPSKKVQNTWYTTKPALEGYMRKQMLREQFQKGLHQSPSVSGSLPPLKGFHADVRKYESLEASSAKPENAESFLSRIENIFEKVIEKKLPTSAKPKKSFSLPTKHIKLVLSSKLLLIAAVIIFLLLSVLPVPVVLSFADRSLTAIREAITDANTVMGFRPGTHENEILLLDKEGNIAIMGHIETEGQFRSYVTQGVAPIVVDSTTTVLNLSADTVDNVSAEEFTLAFVTKNGAMTTEDVSLEGEVSVGKTLTARGATKLLSAVSVGGKLEVFGEAEFRQAARVFGPAYFESLVSLADGLIVEGNVDIKKNLEVRGGIESGSAIIGKSGSFGSLSARGNFSAGGKITLGNPDDVITVNAENLILDKNGNAVFAGNVSAVSLSADSINASTASTTYATSTNIYTTTLVADSATATSATSTNFFAETLAATWARITSLFVDDATVGALTATNSTTTNAYVSSLVAQNATTTSATTTALYAGAATLDALIGADANITRLTAGLATTTSATSTNLFSINSIFTNILGTYADLSHLAFGNATGTNATTTNFFSTKGTFDELYVNNYQQNDGTFAIISTVPTGSVFSVTDNSITSGTLIRQSLTANAGNGQTSYGQIIDVTDSTTAGGGYSALEINVTGAGTGSGDKTLLTLNPGGNNAVVFDKDGALRPTTSAASNTNSIGSASYYWKNGYFDTLTANNLSGTVVTGATSNDTWTIGSTEASDAYKALIFQRNSGSGNALFQWNAGAGDARYLSVNYPFNSTYTVDDSSIGASVNLYSGALTNNTTSGTQRLLSLTNTGTGTTENGIYINNTGTGTTALEIAGTWTNGILTNDNSINTGSGNITTTGSISTTNLTAASSTTTNLVSTYATSTNATSTNFFATTASSTNLYSTSAQFASATLGSATVSNLTAGRVPYISTGGLLADSASFLWDNALSRLTATNIVSTNSTSTNATSTNLVFTNTLTGTDNFIVNTNGNVGIGTSAPIESGVRLQLHNPNTNQTQAYFTNSDTGATSNDGFRIGLGASQTAIVWNNENTALRFGTNNTERVRIDNAGNVGIGTANPPANLSINNLSANTSLTLQSQSQSRWWITANGTSPNNILSIGGAGGTEPSAGAINITSAANVGVGTTSPSARLDVLGSSNGSIPQLKVGDSTGALGYVGIGSLDSNYSWIQSFESVPLYINPLGNNTIFNRDGGNVGIGTTAPGGKLEINAKTNGSGYGLFVDTTTRTSTGSGEEYIRFGDATTADFAVRTNGNVGIGNSTPLSILNVKSNTAPYLTIGGNSGGDSNGNLALDDVAGLVNFYSYDSSTTSTGGIGSIAVRAETAFNTANTPSYMAFYTHTNSTNDGTLLGNVTEKMRITAAGNVGIGTTNPGKKLDLQVGTGDGLAITRSGLAHGLTSELPTNAYGFFRDINGASAGLQIVSASAAAGTSGFTLESIIGSTDPTDSVPAILLEGSKSNGTTGRTAVGNAETVLQVRTGSSSNLLTILGSGNVGIGTTNPSAPLHVYNATGSGGTRITDNSSSTNIWSRTGELVLQNLDSTNNTWTGIENKNPAGQITAGISFQSYDVTNGYSNISFSTNSSSGFTRDVMTLRGANVGIGTTNPSEKLAITGGNLRFNTASSYIDFSGGGSIQGSGTITIAPSSGHVVLNPASGNVGIGTTNPNGKLNIQSSAAGSYLLNLDYADTTDGGGFYESGSVGLSLFLKNTSATQTVQLASAGVSYLNGGNVGIGTTNPNGLLHVYNNSTSPAKIIVENTGSTGWTAADITLKSDGATRGTGIYTFNNVDQETWYMGNRYGDWNAGFFINRQTGTATQSASAAELGATNVTNLFTILNSGNVGIGTTNPNSLFAVGGLVNNLNGQQVGVYYAPTNTSGTYSGTNTQLLTSPAADSSAIFSSFSTELGTASNASNYTATVGLPAFKSAILHRGSGTVTGAANFYALSPSSSSGTITNAYGLFVSPQKVTGVTNGYGVYQNGASDINYFAGNVGIGSTNPGEKLDVVGNTVTQQLRLAVSGNPSGYLTGLSNPAIYAAAATFAGEGSLSGSLVLQSRSSADMPILFVTGSTPSEKMRITAGGNVGIGTTNPAGKLQVSNGDFYLTTGTYYQRAATNSTGVWQLMDSGNTLRARFDLAAGGDASLLLRNGSGTYTTNINANGNSYFTGGNVGIGTTGPGSLLSVKSSSTNTAIGSGAVISVVGNTGGSGSNYKKEIAFKTWDGGTYPQATIGIETTSLTGFEKGDLYFATKNGTTDIAPSEVMRITSAGNVGIGTTTPGTLLTLMDNAGGRKLQINRQGGKNLWFGADTTNGYVDYDGDLLFRGGAAGSTNVVTFTNAGNVGIGTTNPAQKLEVSGIGRFTGTGGLSIGSDTGQYRVQISTTGFTRLSALNTSNGYLPISAQALSIGTIYGDSTPPTNGAIIEGNVGIGTTNPAYSLDINNSGSNGLRVTGGNSQITLHDTGGGNDWILSTQANANLGVIEGSAELFTIKSGGNVGIGTTNPTKKLEVAGDISAGINVITGQYFYSPSGSPAYFSSATNQTTYIGNTSGTGGVNIGNANGNTLIQPTGGNVGIGTTTPAGKLDIYGANPTLYLSDSLSGTNWYTLNDGSYKIAQAGVGSRLTITNTGNIGIGTTNPAVALDVQSAIGRVNVTSTTGTNQARFAAINSAGTAYFGNESSTGGTLLTGSSAYATVVAAAQNRALQFGEVSTGTYMTILPTTGNVGIGTTNPIQKLQVDSGATAYAALALTHDGTGHTASDGLGVGYASRAFLWNYENTSMGLATNNTERIRIQAGGGISVGSTYVTSDPGDGSVIVSGNVGIGTTNPGQKLEVSGGHIQLSSNYEIGRNLTGDTFSYDSKTPANYGLGWFADSQDTNGSWLWASGYSGIKLFTGQNPRLTIINNGNVGIGTTNPASKLHLQGGNLVLRSSGGENRLVTTGADGDTSDIELALFNSDESKTINLNTDGASYFTGGNVGIGTTNPGNKLQIATDSANGSIKEQVTITGLTQSQTAAGSGQLLGFKTNAGYFGSIGGYGNGTVGGVGIWGATNTGAPHLYVQNGGNVGIGSTNPGNKLELVGSANTQIAKFGDGTRSFGINTYSPNSGGIILESGTDPRIAFGGTGGSVLIGSNYAAGNYTGTSNGLLVEGNVGVGVTSPLGKLNVDDPYGVASGSAPQGGIVISNLAAISTTLDLGIDNGYGWVQPRAYNAATYNNLALNPIGGNVGIGTTNPAQKLDVGGDLRVAGNGRLYSNASYFGFHTDGGGALPVKVGSLVVSSSYGNTAPTNGIFTAGAISFNGSQVQGTQTTYGTISLMSAQNSYFGINFGGTTSRANLMFDSSGNGGLYYESAGLWGTYYNRSTNHMSINTSTDYGYTLNVAGSGYFAGDVDVDNSSMMKIPFRAAPAAGSVANGSIIVEDAGFSGTIVTYANGGRYFIRPDGSFDVAERYPASEPLERGDVVMVDPNPPADRTTIDQEEYFYNNNKSATKNIAVKKADGSSPVIGVVSTYPGVLLTNPEDYHNEDKPPVALTGRVPVKISEENGPVNVGDKLTVSPTMRGYAMKLTDSGESIGVALEASAGKAKIEVAINIEHVERGTELANLKIEFEGQVEEYLALEARVANLETAIGLASTTASSTEASSGFSVAGMFDGLWSMMTAKFASAVNGITDFFASRVRTKEFCISDENGETCITKAALDALLANATVSAYSSTTHIPDSSDGDLASSTPDVVDDGGDDSASSTPETITTDEGAGEDTSDETVTEDTGTEDTSGDTASSTPETIAVTE